MTLLALQDLFRRYREKATGVWTLGKDPGRTIFIDYGDTVFAQSTHLQDRLTYILVERGKVTQAQMDYALTNLKPGLSIGKNLIEMGFITQRDLLDVAKAQVERIIRGAIACPDVEPAFEARELDANVVRLPMNTAQLFLAGILSLQDREGLLELLGPLNQVVVLQGRNLLDLTLPQDLAKLPPLLDGTHTLLELSRESMAEPLRLGAFALFLREIGWARLHEMPPLDRQALDLALAPEPEPLSPPFPEPLPETVPTLFSTIQEAARPTTNLEHLSQALDQEAPQPEPVFAAAGAGTETLYLPESLGRPAPAVEAVPERPGLVLSSDPEARLRASGSLDPEARLRASGSLDPEARLRASGESAEGYPPTPALEIEALPEFQEEPPVPLAMSLEYQTTPLLAPFPDEPPAPERTPQHPPARCSRGLLWALVAILLLAGLAAGGWDRYARTPGAARRPWVARIQASLGWPALAPAPRRPAPAPAKPPVPPAAVPAPALPANQVAVPPPQPAAALPANPVAVPPPPAHPAPVLPASQVAVPAPPAPPPARPAPAAKVPEPGVATSLEARVKALTDGDMDLAVQQGRSLAKDIPPGHWTLRLEIACLGGTIQRLMDLFKDGKPDLFVLPIALKDGRMCYQVLYGRYPTRAAAEKDLKRLPPALLADRNQPKIFQFSEIPKIQ